MFVETIHGGDLHRHKERNVGITIERIYVTGEEARWKLGMFDVNF